MLEGFGRPLSDDQAVVDDGQALAELVRFVHHLGGQQDGRALAV